MSTSPKPVVTPPPPVRGWRTHFRHARHLVRADQWFPHLPLALGLALAGLLVLALAFGGSLSAAASQFPYRLLQVAPAGMPFVLIGIALLLMSIGLALRSRFAWVIAILLTIAELVATYLYPHAAFPLLVYYVGALLVALIAARRSFDRSSVAAGTIFAIASSLLLLIYAVFGSLYFGAQFSPPIQDLGTAFYYAIVTMGTVGYGDITPHTPDARLFTVSIIILGIAVFATSISAIVGPLVSGSLSRIVNRKESRMRVTGHFVIVGLTPLAYSCYRELKRRNHPVVLIAPQPPPEGDFDPADVIVGDANQLDVLRRANAGEAQAVLARRNDDSENAFIALAVKELKSKTRTVVAVNDSKHMERVKLVQPDIVIAPQALGGEILAMILSGEPISGEMLLERFLHYDTVKPAS